MHANLLRANVLDPGALVCAVGPVVARHDLAHSSATHLRPRGPSGLLPATVQLGIYGTVPQGDVEERTGGERGTFPISLIGLLL